MSELVQIGNFTENGYQTVVKSAGWRVAYLNNTTDFASDIKYFERHVESDELFILVEGKCKLLLSPTGFENVEVIDMEPLMMYNVLKTSYHAVQMQPGCRILIVENQDVSSDNSLFYHLNEVDKISLSEILK